MVYLVKKHLVNILFMISTFIVLFEISFNFDGEGSDFAFYIISLYIWIITGLLVGLHEMKDMLLDYMNNKELAKKIILTVKIIVWAGIALMMYMVT